VYSIKKAKNEGIMKNYVTMPSEVREDLRGSLKFCPCRVVTRYTPLP
jgi:hypothetical protein